MQNAAPFMILLTAACFPIATCLGQQEQPIEKFYQSLREGVYADYQKTLEMRQVERRRKAKEKLPSLTPKEDEQGMSAIRFLIYNKAMFFVICAEGADRTVSPEQGIASVKECVAARTDEMMKYLKLGDYADTLGSAKFVGCEIKARNFRRELRFPPYD